MIKLINGRWSCTSCGYEWSGMMDDGDIPKTCSCESRPSIDEYHPLNSKAYMWDLNKDFERRDIIITGEKKSNKYDTYSFQNMSLETLQKLFDESFIDPESSQNDSPTFESTLEFMKNHPRFTCHGYAVTIDRDDYRVSIEGVDLDAAATINELIDFVNEYRFADEFNIVGKGCHCHCWFD